MLPSLIYFNCNIYLQLSPEDIPQCPPQPLLHILKISVAQFLHCPPCISTRDRSCIFPLPLLFAYCYLHRPVCRVCRQETLVILDYCEEYLRGQYLSLKKIFCSLYQRDVTFQGRLILAGFFQINTVCGNRKDFFS